MLLFYLLIGLPVLLRVEPATRVLAHSIAIVFGSAAVAGRFFAWTSSVKQYIITGFGQVIAFALATVSIVEPMHRLSFFVGGVLVVALVQGGALSVVRKRDNALSRLRDAKRASITTYTIRKFFNQTLESRALAYFGLPVGFLVGVIIVWWTNAGGLVATNILLISSVVGAGLFLLAELGRNALQMLDPLYDPPETSGALSSIPKRLSGRRLPLVALRQEMPVNVDAQDRFIQDIGCAVADLRKIIFWSSVYGASVLLGLALLLFHLFALPSPQWIAVATVTILFLLVQIPYVLGQASAHKRLLYLREGSERAELQEKLRKTSPLLPSFPALAALTGTGTAGGVLYLILEKMLESVLRVQR